MMGEGEIRISNFNGHHVSVWEDEKNITEMDGGDCCITRSECT